jgi:hypothetical protein
MVKKSLMQSKSSKAWASSHTEVKIIHDGGWVLWPEVVPAAGGRVSQVRNKLQLPPPKGFGGLSSLRT